MSINTLASLIKDLTYSVGKGFNNLICTKLVVKNNTFKIDLKVDFILIQKRSILQFSAQFHHVEKFLQRKGEFLTE